MSAPITPKSEQPAIEISKAPAPEEQAPQEQDTVKSITWQGIVGTKERAARDESRAEGRYRLDEAAMLIEKETGERGAEMLKKLMQAVRGGALTVHEPGRREPYLSATVREWHDEAYWDDLNKWLAESAPRITWRFPDARGTVQDRASLRAEAAPNTRGCKRIILENWDTICQLHGPAANGNQVLRWLKKENVCDRLPAIKTVQNHLSQLRADNLIP